MTVTDLIAFLEDMPEDAEVRIASQPAWPFEYTLYEPVLVEFDEEDDRPSYDKVDGEPMPAIVYLPEGQQLRYLPGVAATEIGWGR